MLARTARFKQLLPSTEAFVDTRLPEYQREIFNVYGLTRAGRTARQGRLPFIEYQLFLQVGRSLLRKLPGRYFVGRLLFFFRMLEFGPVRGDFGNDRNIRELTTAVRRWNIVRDPEVLCGIPQYVPAGHVIHQQQQADRDGRCAESRK